MEHSFYGTAGLHAVNRGQDQRCMTSPGRGWGGKHPRTDTGSLTKTGKDLFRSGIHGEVVVVVVDELVRSVRFCVEKNFMTAPSLLVVGMGKTAQPDSGPSLPGVNY